MSKKRSVSRTTSKITEEKLNPYPLDDDFEKKVRNAIHNHYLEVDSLIRSIFQGYCPKTNMKWSSCSGCHEERPGHLSSVRSNVDRLLQKMIKLHDDLG